MRWCRLHRGTLGQCGCACHSWTIPTFLLNCLNTSNFIKPNALHCGSHSTQKCKQSTSERKRPRRDPKDQSKFCSCHTLGHEVQTYGSLGLGKPQLYFLKRRQSLVSAQLIWHALTQKTAWRTRFELLSKELLTYGHQYQISAAHLALNPRLIVNEYEPLCTLLSQCPGSHV